jgi:hypothetical protein
VIVDRVYAFVSRRTRDAATAEDITAEVFEKALEQAGHSGPGHSTVLPSTRAMMPRTRLPVSIDEAACERSTHRLSMGVDSGRFVPDTSIGQR